MRPTKKVLQEDKVCKLLKKTWSYQGDVAFKTNTTQTLYASKLNP